MKSSIDFITELQERKSRYSNPEQPETLYQALLQLSSGIYAEEERFIYELLQNADDAKEDGTPLTINIIIKDNYFVFAHNGRPFNERDIEGICDIGNGGKQLDGGKIGYKGIGFKSVFHHSNCVTIICPDYQFRFDENHWAGYWDSAWDKSFKLEDGSKYHLPWQLIPIHTSTAPVDVPDGCPKNVQIFIEARDIETLSKKVSHLVYDPNILLFLKNKNISICFLNNDSQSVIATKEEKNGHIVLTLNGCIIEELLMLNPEPINIPKPVRDRIALDFNTPNKMKNATEVELSFALSINDGRIARMDDALVYTYLPTSEKFGFPFIINSNFILDAGRQHLIKDSVWNKYLLSQIPKTLFASLKANHESIIRNFSDSWYSILPDSEIDGALFMEYNDEMSAIIENEPIAPNLNGEFVTVRKAIIDETGLTDVFGKDSIARYVSTRDSTEIGVESFVSTDYSNAFKSYGIHVFGFNDLNAFFEKKYYTIPIEVEGNLSFIHKVFAFYKQLTSEQQSSFNMIMRGIPFVRNSSGSLSKPSDLCVDIGDSSLSEDILLICQSIRGATSTDEDSWLRSLGMGKIGDDKFIVTHILKNPLFITEQNAIKVGRLLIDAYYRGVLTKHKSELKKLPFLTTKNKLAKLESLYLSSSYAPAFDFQADCQRDCFLSERYIENDNHDRWKVFLEDAGCAVFNGLGLIKVSEEEYSAIDHVSAQSIRSQVNECDYLSTTGGKWSYEYSSFFVHYIPMWMACSNNFNLLKKVFSFVFKSPIQDKNENVDSRTGMIDRPLPLKRFLEEGSFLKHAFSHWQLFPCSDGKLHSMQDIFAHKKEILRVGGKYLPVFPFDDVDLSWDNVLRFKTALTLNDYLSILSSISYDTDSDNRERITEIYNLLAEWLEDERIKIDDLSNWGKENRILSIDNSYYPPESLSLIMIKGISDSTRQPYLGSLSDSRSASLMRAFGVQVITSDNCSLYFESEETTSDLVIKNYLLSKVSPIAILTDDGETYITRRSSLVSILENIRFKQCSTIELTYGAYDKKMYKSSYYSEQTFYFVGQFRVSLLNEFMTPLSELLSLSGNENELLMILLEDAAGIKAYLENLGRNVSHLELIDTNQNGENKTFNPILNNIYVDKEKNLITGFKGEIIVYEYLKTLGYEPTCKSITESDAFERLVQYKGKNYRCMSNFDRYDISFYRNGSPVYIEVKATVRSVGELENMPISEREFSMIKDVDNYYIARVFDADSNSPDIYFFKGENNL